jgi:hypothetical protein
MTNAKYDTSAAAQYQALGEADLMPAQRRAPVHFSGLEAMGRYVGSSDVNVASHIPDELMAAA